MIHADASGAVMSGYGTIWGMTEQPPGQQFSRTNLRRGYNADQVDAFLAQVTESISQGRPPPDPVAVRFDPAYGGYDEFEVDTFLDDLAAQLRDAGLL